MVCSMYASHPSQLQRPVQLRCRVRRSPSCSLAAVPSHAAITHALLTICVRPSSLMWPACTSAAALL